LNLPDAARLSGNSIHGSQQGEEALNGELKIEALNGEAKIWRMSCLAKPIPPSRLGID